MEHILQMCRLTMTDFSIIGLAASMVFSGLFYRDALQLSPRICASTSIGLGAILGAHPYYTEYVSFRQAALPMSILFASLWLSIIFFLRAGRTEAGKYPMLACSLLAGVIAMGFNQLAVAFYAIAILCIETNRALRVTMEEGSNHTLSVRKLAIAPLRAAAAGAALVACSLLVSKLVSLSFGTTSDQRASLLAADMIAQRGKEVTALLQVLFAKSEPIAAWPAKVLPLVALGLFLLWSVIDRSISQLLAALICLVAGTAAALIPVTATEIWWPVPRTLIAVPFAIASAISIASIGRHRLGSLFGLILVGSACIFSAHSQSMLFNQQRLNRWDQMRAYDISQRAAEKFPGVAPKLAIVDPSWGYNVAPSIIQGDLNSSAFIVSWAIDSLFDEATGRDQSVRLAPELSDFCQTSKKYPDPYALHLRGEEIVVCMQPR